MTNYKKLLHKYKKPNPSERYRTEYKKQLNQHSRLKNRFLLADEIITETPFHITKTEKKQVQYYIKTVKNFKNLHRQASNEAIILAFIFITKIPNNPKINPEDYTISNKYGLNNTNFRLITCRLNQEILKTLPITIHETNKDPQIIREKNKY